MQMQNVPSYSQSTDPKDRWDYFRTVGIFDVIFGAADGGGQQRWSDVMTVLQTIINAASNQPDVYVICNDEPFFSTYPAANQPTQFDDPVHSNVIDYPNGFNTCKDPSPTGNYLMAYRSNIAGVEYIVLCPNNFNQPSQLAAVNNVEGNELADPSILSWYVTDR
jgi:hypothetical protein